jgi:hypothetical protein
VRDAFVWKLDGIDEYDVRRPLTSTGTNLLGLVKHVAIWDSRYLGEVFDRPFPEPIPAWDDPAQHGTDHWASENESVANVVGLYKRVWAHTDATIDELHLDSRGYVPWWRKKFRSSTSWSTAFPTRRVTRGTPTSCAKASMVPSGLSRAHLHGKGATTRSGTDAAQPSSAWHEQHRAPSLGSG